MKKKLAIFVLIIICIFLFTKEMHEPIFMKVTVQAIFAVVIGFVFFVGYYLVYELPKKHKKKKYDQRYPISTDKLPIKYVSKGDIVLLRDYGEAIYDGKYMFSKKYTVWIKKKDQNQMKEFTEQEFLEQTQKVSCEFGLKWERKN